MRLDDVRVAHRLWGTQVNDAVVNLDTKTRQNAALVEQSAAAAAPAGQAQAQALIVRASASSSAASKASGASLISA